MKRAILNIRSVPSFEYGGNTLNIRGGRHVIGDSTVTRPDGTVVLLDKGLADHILSKFAVKTATREPQAFASYEIVEPEPVEAVVPEAVAFKVPELEAEPVAATEPGSNAPVTVLDTVLESIAEGAPKE